MTTHARRWQRSASKANIHSLGARLVGKKRTYPRLSLAHRGGAKRRSSGQVPGRQMLKDTVVAAREAMMNGDRSTARGGARGDDEW